MQRHGNSGIATELIFSRPVHGPALPVSCGFVTQAGRYVSGPGWVGSEQVAAGLKFFWVGSWVGPDGSNGLHELHLHSSLFISIGCIVCFADTHANPTYALTLHHYTQFALGNKSNSCLS
jgi:hypothetical protein